MALLALEDLRGEVRELTGLVHRLVVEINNKRGIADREPGRVWIGLDQLGGCLAACRSLISVLPC